MQNYCRDIFFARKKIIIVNYIKEINSFYDWIETNSISHSAINLWHALLHINNKASKNGKWIEEFSVAISTLSVKTCLSKSSIIRAREQLKESGRIDFIERSGNQSCVYKLIAFHTDTQSATQSATQCGTQSGTQSATINKLNKTKLNNNRISVANATPPPKIILEEKLEERQKDFYNQVAEFSKTYPAEMLRKFFNYWTEANQSKTKMRFEMERTWELSKRLATWAGRDKEFKNPINEQEQITTKSKLLS